MSNVEDFLNPFKGLFKSVKFQSVSVASIIVYTGYKLITSSNNYSSAAGLAGIIFLYAGLTGLIFVLFHIVLKENYNHIISSQKNVIENLNNSLSVALKNLNKQNKQIGSSNPKGTQEQGRTTQSIGEFVIDTSGVSTENS